jgi:hypothetical protein
VHQQSQLAVAVLIIINSRYFDDSVRDDYAAGQLDAQVSGCLFYHFWSFTSFQGRGCPSRNEGIVNLRRKLDRTSHCLCSYILEDNVVDNKNTCVKQLRINRTSGQPTKTAALREAYQLLTHLLGVIQEEHETCALALWVLEAIDCHSFFPEECQVDFAQQ